MVMGTDLGCFCLLWMFDIFFSLKLLDNGSNVCLDCLGKIKVN